MTEPAAGLQFDTAEPMQGTPTDVRCRACGDALGSYFEVNGAIACARCKDKALAEARRSHVPTLLKASGLGLVAAAAGSALYYGVAVLTGYELSILSIVVGLAVGFAVRKGSGARGGWRYQALAVFLTYLAISSTYVPRVFSAMEKEKAQAVTAAPGDNPAAPQEAGTQAAADASAPASEAPTVGGFLVAVAMLLAFTLALPFLSGLDNLMGLVIIAIGLYEAWKVNRIPALSVTGPFTVASQGAAADA